MADIAVSVFDPYGKRLKVTVECLRCDATFDKLVDCYWHVRRDHKIRRPDFGQYK